MSAAVRGAAGGPIWWSSAALGLLALFGVTLIRSEGSATTPLPTQEARSAGAFTRSVCVGTHFGYPDTPYATRYAAVRSGLLASGIRTIRDGGSAGSLLGRLRSLGDSGVSTVFVMSPATGVAPSKQFWSAAPHRTLAQAIAAVGVQHLRAVEVDNELDTFFDTHHWHPGDAQPLSADPSSPVYWVRYARALTRATYVAVHDDPVDGKVPVLGPSMASLDDYARVGNLAPYLDAASVHWYLAGYPPDTGARGAGSLPYLLVRGHLQSGSKPVVITEGGYSNATEANPANTPPSVDAAYVPRAFLTSFAAGVSLNCKYELVDEFRNPRLTDPEAHFGLLTNDLRPKPAYTSVRNLLGLLGDERGTAGPGRLQYGLAGSDGLTRSVLLRKRDGSYWLAVWQATSLWDPVRGRPLTGTARRLTLNLAGPARLTLYRPDRSETAVGTARGSRLAFRADGDVTLIKVVAAQ